MQSCRIGLIFLFKLVSLGVCHRGNIPMSVISFPGQGADSEGATGVAGADAHHMPGAVCGSSAGRIGPSQFVPSWACHGHGMTESLKPLAVPLMTLSGCVPGRAAASSLQGPAEPRCAQTPHHCCSPFRAWPARLWPTEELLLSHDHVWVFLSWWMTQISVPGTCLLRWVGAVGA